MSKKADTSVQRRKRKLEIPPFVLLAWWQGASDLAFVAGDVRGDHCGRGFCLYGAIVLGCGDDSGFAWCVDFGN